MTWGGVLLGAASGGLAAFAAGKLLRQSPGPGVIAAASAAGGLIGGALTAASSAADTGPTLYRVDLAQGVQTLAVKVGDVVDLLPVAGATITNIATGGSDVVSIASLNPATVNVVKKGGALLIITMSNGETTQTKLTATA